jgi:hypothetical protein
MDTIEPSSLKSDELSSRAGITDLNDLYYMYEPAEETTNNMTSSPVTINEP